MVTDDVLTVDAGPPVTPAPAAADAATPGHHHTRLIISIALLVVTLVATPLFIVAIWVHTSITDTDRYVKTVAPLADADWAAVRAMVPRHEANPVMDALVELGAKVILASDIRSCRL